MERKCLVMLHVSGTPALDVKWSFQKSRYWARVGVFGPELKYSIVQVHVGDFLYCGRFLVPICQFLTISWTENYVLFEVHLQKLFALPLEDDLWKM